MTMNARRLGHLMEVLQIFRSVDSHLPAQTAHCFVVVAEHPGISMAEIGRRVGLVQSSCSRNVGTLGSGYGGGSHAHGLVEMRSDPAGGGRMLVYPTAKGLRLASDLVAAMR